MLSGSLLYTEESVIHVRADLGGAFRAAELVLQVMGTEQPLGSSHLAPGAAAAATSLSLPSSAAAGLHVNMLLLDSRDDEETCLLGRKAESPREQAARGAQQRQDVCM